MQDIPHYQRLSIHEKLIADQIHILMSGCSGALLAAVAIDAQAEYLIAEAEGADINMIQDYAIDAANERS